MRLTSSIQMLQTSKLKGFPRDEEQLQVMQGGPLAPCVPSSCSMMSMKTLSFLLILLTVLILLLIITDELDLGVTQYRGGKLVVAPVRKDSGRMTITYTHPSRKSNKSLPGGVTMVTYYTRQVTRDEAPVKPSAKNDSDPITNMHTEFSPVPRDPLPGEVTIVTAYINIGQHTKGSTTNIRKPSDYLAWMQVFRFISNPVVAYFNKEEDLQKFAAMRRNSSGLDKKTKVKLIDENSLWAFGLKPNISRIYNISNYPKHYPNTVYPEYACAMHAKYELLQFAMTENYFSTQYFAWMDIGYFREVNLTTCHNFKITLPPIFDRSKVSYNRVYEPIDCPKEQIFSDNLVWIGGGMIMGEAGTLRAWTEEYFSFLRYFIANNLMSTDQQILYASYKHLKPKTRLQLYGCSNSDCEKFHINDWFYLGYLCAYPSLK